MFNNNKWHTYILLLIKRTEANHPFRERGSSLLNGYCNQSRSWSLFCRNIELWIRPFKLKWMARWPLSTRLQLKGKNSFGETTWKESKRWPMDFTFGDQELMAQSIPKQYINDYSMIAYKWTTDQTSHKYSLYPSWLNEEQKKKIVISESRSSKHVQSIPGFVFSVQSQKVKSKKKMDWIQIEIK